MGSGETAPTMVTPHRDIVARLGDVPPRAVLLDTPYGFQENGPEITQKAVEYFAKRVQLTIDAAGYPGPLAADPAQRTAGAEAGALSRLRTANFIFAGPGSPSYALSVWRGSPIPEALATRLADGAALVFASAAALTLGRFTIPVYEIYKAGQPAQWLDGLDLMRAAGFEGSCVVIPHYDNAEGGTHDTRFCYMGERRLSVMEAMLPDDAWVLGVDEHTAVIMDLDAGTVSISGRGALTVRRRGASRSFAAGEQLGLDTLKALARGETSAPRRGPGTAVTPSGATATHRARRRRQTSARHCSPRRIGSSRPSGARWARARRARPPRRSCISTARSRSGRPTACSRTSPSGRARSCTRWSIASARRRPPASATPASAWRRSWRASSRSARSCARPRPGSWPIASATG